MRAARDVGLVNSHKTPAISRTMTPLLENKNQKMSAALNAASLEAAFRPFRTVWVCQAVLPVPVFLSNRLFLPIPPAPPIPLSLPIPPFLFLLAFLPILAFLPLLPDLPLAPYLLLPVFLSIRSFPPLVPFLSILAFLPILPFLLRPFPPVLRQRGAWPVDPGADLRAASRGRAILSAVPRDCAPPIAPAPDCPRAGRARNSA